MKRVKHCFFLVAQVARRIENVEPRKPNILASHGSQFASCCWTEQFTSLSAETDSFAYIILESIFTPKYKVHACVEVRH